MTAETFEDRAARIGALITEHGITLADVVGHQAAEQADDPRAQRIIQAAHDEHYEPGVCEIDTPTVTSGSEGGGGDYVLAWVWVGDDEDDEDDDAEDDEP